MIVYGRNPVRETLRGRRTVRRVWATRRAAREPWLAGVRVELAEPADLAELCGSPDHQGVCADAGPYPYVDADGLLAEPDALVLALDQVQDPHNLGAVCRVAEAAGAAGLVLPERRAAAVTAAVCRTSAGAVEHLRLARVRNLADWLEAAKRAGAFVFGAAAGGEPYERLDYSGRIVLVLGAEGRGLRPRVATACDALIGLPMRGRVESLNVATAAAGMLYGILQLRDRALDRGS